MTDTAIKVENLSKRYRIGQYVGSGAQYKTLRESLTNAVSAPLRRLRQTGDGRPKTEDRRSRSPVSGRRSSNPGPPSPVPGQPSTARFIWALRDVSFEVKQGEVLGIIGRNGAGKSTLLKVLSRITEPTEGGAELKGRVGSLLEVGTGFHPELTGRENIYLSGAILGMARKEIDRKFDAIVDFSGVETYIDTPVKRYSSGMRVRLGFAVAAYLEPDILLVDEVLAVGDYEFQKKCLGKMQDVAGEGRTVLFVSHNMASIEKLCHNAILIEKGAIKHKGPARETIDQYLVRNENENLQSSAEIAGPEEKHGILKSIRLLNDNGEQTGIFHVGEEIVFELFLDSGEITLNSPRIVVSVGSRKHGPICNFVTDQMVNKPFKVKGKTVIKCIWDECYLIPGIYFVSLKIAAINTGRINSILQFEIREKDIYGTGKEVAGNPKTVMIPNGHWQFN